MTRDAGRAAGLVVFTTTCLSASWMVAATLRALHLDATRPLAGPPLFALSLQYVLSMGWQPIAAAWLVRRWIDRDPVDLALRPAEPRFSVFAVALPIALACGAALLSLIGVRYGLVAVTSWSGSVPGDASRRYGPGLGLAALSVFGLALIWLQAVAEEVGWRGYVLSAATRRFGHARGLVLHAVLWALWYAPVVFFATHAGASGLDSLARGATFAVTCVLLGVLLGWLRLAANSVAPAVTANLTLTVAAGLPYVMHGVDAGLRSAIYRPVGWLVLVAAIVALFGAGRHDARHA